jgi:hypothetical protein
MNGDARDAMPAGTAAPEPAHDDRSIPWPGRITTPFRPAGMREGYYAFEERYPPPERLGKRAYVSEQQLAAGTWTEALDFREDWLLGQFPAPPRFRSLSKALALQPPEPDVDWPRAAAWLRHHATSPRDRATPAAPADRPPRAAPIIEHLSFPPAPADRAALRSLSVHRTTAGHRYVSLTFQGAAPPGERPPDVMGLKSPPLTVGQAEAIAAVLLGWIAEARDGD